MSRRMMMLVALVAISTPLWAAVGTSASATGARDSGGGSSAAVEAAMRRLSVEEKIGQLFMIAADTEIAARHEALIRGGHLGGILLRWDRFTGPEVRDFAAKMRSWTDASPGRIPLFFAADHEGGPLFTQRGYGATLFPGNMALGASGDARLAREAAKIAGRELRALGVQIDFAPVVDINNNPKNPIIGIRSFGEDPRFVSELGAAAVRGYLEGGILPVAKHFPGHGDTVVDSHSDLPVISRPLSELESVELMPFRAAVQARVPIIMTAHIILSAVDPHLPITLSSAALQGILREKLGFDGVVVSDSLDMGAVTNAYGVPEAAVRALGAGCDILLLGKGDFPASYQAVLGAVKAGRISGERLDDSVQRILRAKEQAGLLGGSRAPTSAMAEVGGAAHYRTALRVAERAVTLLNNRRNLLPLRLPDDRTLVAVLARSDRYAPEMAGFLQELRRRHGRIEFVEIPPIPGARAVEEAVHKARAADVLLVGTYQTEALNNSRQVGLYRRLRKLKKPLIVVSLMNPYDLKDFTDADARLCIYGITPASLQAFAEILFGEVKPAGRLPVTIPRADEAGR